MANSFFLQCELDQGKETLYHTRAPYWCDWHSVTEEFEIDFANFTADGDGNVAETASVLDSLGNLWKFNGTDDDWFVGEYYTGVDNPCPGSLSIYENKLSTWTSTVARPLVLAPDGVGKGGGAYNQGGWGGVPPRFNRNYAWSILIEGTAVDGTMQFEAEASEPPVKRYRVPPHWDTNPVDSPDWGHELQATMTGHSLGQGQFNFQMSGPCKKGSPNVNGQNIRYRWTNEVCVCQVIRVDPCAHKLDQIVRIHNYLDPNDIEVFYWDGVARRNPDPREKSFSIRCDDWWKIDPMDPWWRGEYRPSQTAEVVDAIPPPNLLGDFSHDQRMRITFGSTGVNIGTDLYIRRFKLFPRYLTDSELNTICPIA